MIQCQYNRITPVTSQYNFRRASGAYGINGRYRHNNDMRLYPDPWGRMKAVLVEEGTTNLIKNPSASSDLTYWDLNKNANSVAFMTRVTNDGVFGNTCVECTRTKLVTPGWIVFQQNFYQYASQPYFDTTKQYTLSFYAKSVSGSNIITVSIRNSNGLGTVLDNTTVTLTNTWQRYVITFTPLISGEQPVLYIVTHAHADNTTFRIAAIQIEQKPYATSFIDGTRSPETLTIPSSVLNPQEGTVECWARTLDLYSRRRDVFTVNKPVSSNDRVILGYKVIETGLELFWKPANATQYIIRATNLDAVADWVYVGFRYKWNGAGYDLALLYNGQVVATGTATNGQMTNFYQALLGCTDPGSGVFTNYANMLYDDLRISSRARSDAEIAAAYGSGQPLPVDEYTTFKLYPKRAKMLVV